MIFLMVIAFGSNDTEKFITYASYTVLITLTTILGSYISSKFISLRMAYILGIIIAAIGILIMIYSFKFFDKTIFYLGLSFMTVGTGIFKCNSFVINSNYLRNDVKENQEDWGSILHFSIVFISFVIMFSQGYIIQKNIMYVLYTCFGFLVAGLSIFILNEKKNLMISIKNTSVNFQKIIKLPIIITSAISCAFVFLFYNNNIVIFNLPLVIFVLFYAYLIMRAIKFANERSHIIFAILFGVIYIFYCTIERQRDMTLALFLERNVRSEFFHLHLSPLQINSLYTIFVLIVSIILFKYKLHSRLSNIKIFSIILFNTFIAFLILYIGCTSSDKTTGVVNIWFYIFSMLSMSICNIMINTKLISVCRIMPDNIKSIIASFELMNLGIAFYLSKIVSGFAAINHYTNDKLYSAIVYQEFFKNIAICTFIFFIILLLLGKQKYIKGLIEFDTKN